SPGIEQSLGQVDLEASAGVDVFDGPANRLEIGILVEIARQILVPGVRKAGRQWRAVCRPSANTRALSAGKKLLNLANSVLRAAAASIRIRFGKTRRNNPSTVLFMIESQHPIIKTHG